MRASRARDFLGAALVAEGSPAHLMAFPAKGDGSSRNAAEDPGSSEEPFHMILRWMRRLLGLQALEDRLAALESRLGGDWQKDDPERKKAEAEARCGLRPPLLNASGPTADVRAYYGGTKDLGWQPDLTRHPDNPFGYL